MKFAPDPPTALLENIKCVCVIFLVCVTISVSMLTEVGCYPRLQVLVTALLLPLNMSPAVSPLSPTPTPPTALQIHISSQLKFCSSFHNIWIIFCSVFIKLKTPFSRLTRTRLYKLLVIN